MANHFLLIKALKCESLGVFGTGLSKLIQIQEKVLESSIYKSDIFFRDSEIYNQELYYELVQNYTQENQIYINYIEQLSACEKSIENEKDAYDFCGDDLFGFLGIFFEKNYGIEEIKQIVCSDTYENWHYYHSSNFVKLEKEITNSLMHRKFRGEFDALTPIEQGAILKCFKDAKAKDYDIDGSLIKDVSPDDSKIRVYELRIRTPELRVYFSFKKGLILIASVKKKSSADQSGDISAAHLILKDM